MGNLIAICFLPFLLFFCMQSCQTSRAQKSEAANLHTTGCVSFAGEWATTCPAAKRVVSEYMTILQRGCEEISFGGEIWMALDEKPQISTESILGVDVAAASSFRWNKDRTRLLSNVEFVVEGKKLTSETQIYRQADNVVIEEKSNMKTTICTYKRIR